MPPDTHVVFLQPETSGNIGALARVMKNFGFSKLVLVDPLCPIDDAAVARAKHAQDILESVETVTNLSVIRERYNLLVATSAITGNAYNITRDFLTVRDFAERYRKIRGKIAIVFGREGEGLHNREIDMCDILVNIPSSPVYRTLNVTHAAAIIFYELFLSTLKEDLYEELELAREKEKDLMIGYIRDIMNIIGLSGDKRKKTITGFRRIIGKSMLTRREAFLLLGFFRGLKERLTRDR